jgi:hypothetical protein
MAVTNYFCVGNELVGEQESGGTRRNYGIDALGSVTATIQGSVIENTYTYKPYGQTIQKIGTAPDPKFKWVGSQGYRAEERLYSETYIRARHYSDLMKRWPNLDPLWPNEAGYEYSQSRPCTANDFSGLCPLPVLLLGPLACAAWDALDKFRKVQARIETKPSPLDKNACSNLKGTKGACIAMLCSFSSINDWKNILGGMDVDTFTDLLKKVKKYYGEEAPNPLKCCKDAGSGSAGIFSLPGIIALACADTRVKDFIPNKCYHKHKDDPDNASNNCHTCCDQMFNDINGVYHVECDQKCNILED